MNLNQAKFSLYSALIILGGCASVEKSDTVRGQARIVYKDILSTVVAPEKVATYRPIKDINPVRFVRERDLKQDSDDSIERAVVSVPDYVPPQPLLTQAIRANDIRSDCQPRYTVMPGDYLIQVANKHSYLGGKVDQRSSAFYLANMSAFENGNPNLLLKNSVLVIPTRKEVAEAEPFYLLKRRMNLK